jgi:hypothetical protein
VDFLPATGASAILAAQPADTAFTATMGSIVDFDHPEITKDTPETFRLNQTDRYIPWISGKINPGEITLTLDYDVVLHALVLDHVDDLNYRWYRIDLPKSESEPTVKHKIYQRGNVTSVKVMTSDEEEQRLQIKIKCLGKPALVAAP